MSIVCASKFSSFLSNLSIINQQNGRCSTKSLFDCLVLPGKYSKCWAYFDIGAKMEKKYFNMVFIHFVASQLNEVASKSWDVVYYLCNEGTQEMWRVCLWFKQFAKFTLVPIGMFTCWQPLTQRNATFHILLLILVSLQKCLAVAFNSTQFVFCSQTRRSKGIPQNIICYIILCCQDPKRNRLIFYFPGACSILSILCRQKAIWTRLICVSHRLYVYLTFEWDNWALGLSFWKWIKT